MKSWVCIIKLMCIINIKKANVKELKSAIANGISLKSKYETGIRKETLGRRGVQK